MKHVKKTEKILTRLEQRLKEEEKSLATREKYIREVMRFLDYLEVSNRKVGARPNVMSEAALSYKSHLMQEGYSHSTINTKLAALRMLFKSMGCEDVNVKNHKMQKSAYVDETRMLTRWEYKKLIGSEEESNRKGKIKSAKGKTALSRGSGEQIRLIVETIAGTGIRVSELQYFTVEGVSEGEITIYLKGKERKILIPCKLRKKLISYAKRQSINEGPIFLNGKGEPLHRSQVWQMMKRLCRLTGVDSGKVFPHNLRKLFARTFYKVKKDIAKLADVLGHSSINTTRIYIATTVREHMAILDRMNLVT